MSVLAEGVLENSRSYSRNVSRLSGERDGERR
jgi:hypothetical protein